jgi:putative transposase
MKKRKRHTHEQIVAKLRDADVMLNSGKDIAAVLQSMENCEATYQRWRTQYGGMKSDEAKRLKELEIENSRLKRCWPMLSSIRRCSKRRFGETAKPDAKT